MKLQATIVSAYLASIIIIIVVLFHYILIFPYTTTIAVKTKYYDIKTIIYSKPIWTARQLASKLLNIFNAKYVDVNITIINITNLEIISTDNYVITSINDNSTIMYEFKFSKLDISGRYYIYIIRVGY